MIGGYAGKILWVDLTEQKFTTLNTLDYAEYIGGQGMALRLQWEFGNPEVKDGMDPRSLLMFMSGPLAGTPAPGASRGVVCFKETTRPPKNWWTSSGIGGWFTPEMKFAGYDGIVFQGASRKPVYLWVDDEKVELRDASKFWGMGTYMTIEQIRKELGGDPKIQMGVIGPAGENLCRASSIQFDVKHSASQHPGSVMGSKKLKAVAVRGTGGIHVANPTALLADHWKHLNLFMDDAGKRSGNRAEARDNLTYKAGFGCFGCTSSCQAFLEPTEGPRGGSICGFRYSYLYTRQLYSGFSKLEKTPFGDTHLQPPPKKAPKKGIGGRYADDNVEPISYQFPKLFDEYGLSGYDGFATKGNPGLLNYLCYDKAMGDNFRNLVTAEMGGAPGSIAFAHNAPRAAAFREGKIGPLLGDGAQYMASKVKEHPEDYGLTKAQGQLAWESYERQYLRPMVTDHHFYRPRSTDESWLIINQVPLNQMAQGIGSRDMGVVFRGHNLYDDICNNTRAHSLAAYGTDAACARYLDAKGKPLLKNQKGFAKKETYYDFDGNESKPVKGNYTVGVPLALKLHHAFYFQKNSLLLCRSLFTLIAKGGTAAKANDPRNDDVQMGARLYSAVTGINTSYEKLLEASWRCIALERAIHMRDDNRTRADDYFTSFTHDRPDANGIKLDREEYRKGLDMYSELMGFDKATGNPTQATLKKYGMQDVADKLQAMGKLPA